MSTGAPRVAIVGGGIGGLSAAYELERCSREAGFTLAIDLFEASDRLGGVIRTERDGPFTLDTGPDSLVTIKPEGLELARELGLEDELVPADEARRGLALYSRGRLRRVPFGATTSLIGLARRFAASGVMSFPGMVRMGLDLVMPRGRGNGDVSMAEFFSRRLGDEGVERLVDPLLAGTYSGDPHRLSLSATLPRFVDSARTHRSLVGSILGAGGRGPLFVTPHGGMGALIERLAGALSATTVRTNSKVIALSGAGGSYTLETIGGPERGHLAVVIAAPAHAASSIIQSLAPALASELTAIRYVSTATVFFAFELKDLRARPDGHGFLVPRVEGRRINGATWISNKYPMRAPAEFFLARCYVGGDRTPAQLQLDDAELAATCLAELKSIAGIDARPLLSRVFRWRDANPQYEVGHQERVKRIERLTAEAHGLWLTGAAYRGVGISDCIRDGRDTGRQAFEFVRQAVLA